MKKLYLLLLSLLSYQAAFSQINFERIAPPAPAPQIIPAFEAVDEGDIAYADVDGINGLDVLITGNNNSNEAIAKLYINDGNGNYTEKTGTPFVGVTESSVAFADIDDNGTQDVLITGFDGSNPTAILYINDGNGNFTEDTGTSLDGVRSGDVAFADFDNEKGPDILIIGFNGTEQTSKLYMNDGLGNFTEADGANTVDFARINNGALDVADVDEKNGLDIVITGRSFPSNVPVTEIYLNDGTADFTKLTGSTFEGVRDSDVAFADVDGNGTQDLLISGFNSSNDPTTKLYKNEITGGIPSFTEVDPSPFTGLGFSSVAFADIKEDNNNDLDLIITGEISFNNIVTKLYTNDGNGTFTEVSGTPFTNISRGSVAFLDIEGDNDSDLVISGQSSSGPVTEIYANDGNGAFTIATGTPFEGVRFSASDFADVNENQDVIITGRNNSNVTITKLYTNDGNGNFAEVNNTPFTGVGNSAIAFSDVDGVNGQDVLISGSTFPAPVQYLTTLYTKNMDGNFEEKTTSFEGLESGSIAFADIDGDSDQDVVITGFTAIPSFEIKTILYENDGNGNFSPSGQNFEGVRFSSITFADMDGDGEPDLIISGENSSQTEDVTILYFNDGNGSGTFTDSGLTFDGVSNGSIATGDVDGDGSLDLLVTGSDIAKLYINEGTAGTPSFAAMDPSPFSGVSNSAAKIADIDGRNGNDIIISGDEGGELTTKLYINDGNGNFTEETDLPFEGVSQGDISLADVDDDGLLDVLITGRNQAGQNISYLYRNLTDSIPPIIESPTTVSVDENTSTSFYTASANEADVTFSLGITKDEAFFTLSGDQLSFKTAPDFETPLDDDEDNVYLIDLIATDKGRNEVSIEVAITVLDVDEIAPVITSDAAVSVAENVTGTVYTATADETVTFSLGDSKDEAVFNLSTNEISFNSSPDFETPLDANEDNVYELDIIATDDAGNTTTKAITITVTDVDEPGPVISSPAAVSVEENVMGTVYTITSDVTATFSLGTDKDEALFDLATDAISFKSTPDFEAPLDANEDNVYELDVLATDGDGNSTTKAIRITVTDVEELGPVISSPTAVSVEENVTGTVYTITSDVTATFSLGTDKDEALFDLATDAISFKSAPDFEAPQDANEDNVYELDVLATDGDGNTTTKAIRITVTDVEELGPVISSPTAVSVEENVAGTIYTITSDVTATFSLGIDKDEALFDLATDAISFKSTPDFEAPQDANEDNVYELDVLATDGDGNSTTKAIRITVTDVEEEPLSNDKEILSKVYPNPVQTTLYFQPVNMAIGADIRILDITGRIQKAFKYNGKNQEIDVSELSNGVYTLSVSSKGKQMQIKFIKE